MLVQNYLHCEEIAMSMPTWYVVAEAEIGTKEVKGGENPRILEYHATTTLKATEDEVPWCSSFVNWCMIQGGFAGTNSAAARSWLAWGEQIKQAEPGCVVVLKRGSSETAGHVGFFAGFSGPDRIRVLGGNQSDSVKFSSYPVSDVLSYRWAE
jgi:uncharacterized protein (TIGR02594 family)